MKKDELEAAILAMTVNNVIAPTIDAIIPEPSLQPVVDIDVEPPKSNKRGTGRAKKQTPTDEECKKVTTKKVTAKIASQPQQEARPTVLADSTSRTVETLEGCPYVVTTLDFKALNAAAKDTVLHGYRFVYNNKSYNAIVYENYCNRHLLRFFMSDDSHSMIMFTYVPRGVFGNNPMFDSEMVVLDRLASGGYEKGFDYNPRMRMVLRNGSEIKHMNELLDSFIVSQDGSVKKAAHRFAPDPLVSRYCIHALRRYECIEAVPTQQNGVITKMFRCVDEEKTAKFEMHLESGMMYWFTVSLNKT